MQRIRLGTDLSLAAPWNTTHLLEPLSGAVRNHPDREPRRAEVTREWMDAGPRLFELAEIGECDVAVLPFDWERTSEPSARAAADRFLQRAAAADRTVIVLDHADAPTLPDRPGVIAFARSLHARARRESEFAQPPWFTDPEPAGGIRARPEVPTVTFCGYASHLARAAAGRTDRLKLALRTPVDRILWQAGLDERRGLRAPVFHRADALRVLERSRVVRTDFILRDVSTDHENLEGRRPADGSMSVADYRREYFASIEAGDYVLAVRGDGNYSIRFYETMASARIPLLVDTHCVLPLDSHVDWESLIVRVDGSRTRRLDRELLVAHGRMDADEFAGRQRACRRVWEQHLTMSGFFTWLHRALVAAADGGPLTGGEGHGRIIRSLLGA